MVPENVRQDLLSDVLDGKIEDTLISAGHSWTLHTLNDGEAQRAKRLVLNSKVSHKALALSLALSAVDGVPLSEEDRKHLYQFFTESPAEVVGDLFDFYMSLENRRKTVVENVRQLTEEDEWLNIQQYVLARRWSIGSWGDLQEMNPTRWAWLYLGIQRNELQQVDLLRDTLAKALGLNLFPVRDEKTGKLRPPEKFQEMMPLIIAAMPGTLKTLPDLWEELEKQNRPELVGEVSDRPIELDTDTGLEILDKPIDHSKLSEAERRQLLAAAGILPASQKTFTIDEQDTVIVHHKAPTEAPATRRGSFALDD